jgi:hypothetical protein
MQTRLDRGHRALPVILGVIALSAAAILIAWDMDPALLARKPHALIEAVSLAMIAVAYLVYQSARRPSSGEWVKTVLLACAFFFWAANQVWPNPRQASVLNDLAIALFVLDVFLVMIGWPPTSQDESFAESYPKSRTSRD